MDIIFTAETVEFKRPDSEKIEHGIMVGHDDKHIIIDQDLNIVINCSIEHYNNNQTRFILM